MANGIHDDVIMDGLTKFRVIEVRVKYLSQGIRFSAYVEQVQPVQV